MPRKKSRPFCQASPSLFERFWEHFTVGAPDECWEWDGAYRMFGYGYIQDISRKNWLAHRVAYYLHYGEDPGDLFVCHRCDNPPCVNWNHLFKGTQRDNTLDRHAKGRTI